MAPVEVVLPWKKVMTPHLKLERKREFVAVQMYAAVVVEGLNTIDFNGDALRR